MAIDLKNPGERETIEALVRWADVLVENFRPGVTDRLGLADDRLAELNSAPVQVDGVQVDGVQVDGVQVDGVQADGN